MKKWQKGTLIGIGCIFLFLGGVALWQRDNLQVLYEVTKYKTEDLGAQIQVTQAEVADALEQYNLSSIRRLTPEEEEQVKKGELSWEEAIEKIIPSQEVSQTQQSADTHAVAQEETHVDMQQSATKTIQELAPASSQPEQAPSVNQESELVGTATVKMYALQAKYLGLLGGLESRGIQALKAIPSNQRTMEKMVSVGMPFVQEALALEKQCDAEVDQVLRQLQKGLKALKADQTIVETMRSAYHTEKRLKKAYYLSLIPN